MKIPQELLTAYGDLVALPDDESDHRQLNELIVRLTSFLARAMDFPPAWGEVTRRGRFIQEKTSRITFDDPLFQTPLPEKLQRDSKWATKWATYADWLNANRRDGIFAREGELSDLKARIIQFDNTLKGRESPAEDDDSKDDLFSTIAAEIDETESPIANSILRDLFTRIDRIHAEASGFHADVFRDFTMEPEPIASTRTIKLAVGHLMAHLEKSSERKKKLGRTPKTETPLDAKVLAAIKAMLNNQKYGRDTPPKGREIAESASVSPMEVTRFMKTHFGNQNGFEGAWRRDDVRAKLVMLEYAPESHAEYDDNIQPTGGVRRRGRTPGTDDYEED